MPAVSKTRYITFSALISALIVAVMAVSRLIPVGIYAIPPLCSVFVMVVLIECNTKWAIFCYIVSALLSLIVADPESAMIFVVFFGYYPIIKLFLEKIQNKVLKWITKILIFNVVIFIGYFVLNLIMPVLEDFMKEGTVIFVGFLLAVEVMFVLYDICISRLSVTYVYKYHKTVSKIFKK